MIRISVTIAFIFGALLMFLVFCIVAPIKEKKPNNKIHFYIARDKNGELRLYIGKPIRYNTCFCASLGSFFIFPYYTFHRFGLNKEDYNNLKWEDEPIEVFVNTEV